MASTVLKEILLLASVILPQLALLGWGVLGAWGPSNFIELYCPIYNRSSGRNWTFGFPAMLEFFLRAIYGDSILLTSSPRANIVQFCVHASRTVEIAVHCLFLCRSIFCDRAAPLSTHSRKQGSPQRENRPQNRAHGDETRKTGPKI